MSDSLSVPASAFWKLLPSGSSMSLEDASHPRAYRYLETSLLAWWGWPCVSAFQGEFGKHRSTNWEQFPAIQEFCVPRKLLVPHPLSDFGPQMQCPHAFHLLRRGVLSLHKTQSQILPRNPPGIWNLPAQAAARLPGRQRAPTVVPLGWPQIPTLFSVLSNESVIDGIAPFHWGPLHGCFLQNLSSVPLCRPVEITANSAWRKW